MNLLEFLQSLGNTKEEVAAYLKEKGFKGSPRHRHCCPIAVALRAEFHQIPTVTPGKSCLRATVNGGVTQEAYLPTACMAFVAAFDEREYPELEDIINEHHHPLP